MYLGITLPPYTYLPIYILTDIPANLLIYQPTYLLTTLLPTYQYLLMYSNKILCSGIRPDCIRNRTSQVRYHPLL